MIAVSVLTREGVFSRCLATATIAGRRRRSRPLTAATLREQDCIVVLVAHAAVDLALVTGAAPLVFDATGATHGITCANVTRL